MTGSLRNERLADAASVEPALSAAAIRSYLRAAEPSHGLSGGRFRLYWAVFTPSAESSAVVLRRTADEERRLNDNLVH